MPFSYGFRPKRSCHDALDQLDLILHRRPIHWIVDADISGFFNHVNHEWMIKFLEVRIGDPNILRLIQRMLKAGIEEEGNLEPSEEGTPQGSIISPLLANVYLHYALDLWFEKRIKKQCRGEAEIIRYADDFVCCFQYEGEARAFYKALQERLGKFGLSIAEEKTKIIRFGKGAEDWHDRNGGGKPETFTFLGFTHYCSKSRNGKFQSKRKTSEKKYRAKLKEFKGWMKIHRHEKLEDTLNTIRKKLIGHYRYYGMTHNYPSIAKFKEEVIKIMFKWLNRRSQRKSFTQQEFFIFLGRNPLPEPKIYKSYDRKRYV